MPRVLKFRPLCDQCERAEASVWCLGESSALCKPCDANVHQPRRMQRHRRVPIGASSVVSALCARCASAPAAKFVVDHSVALCELCAGESPRSPRDVMPLRDSPAAGSITFDKMDFSSVRGSKRARVAQAAGADVDVGMRPSTVSTSGRKVVATVGASEAVSGKMWRWMGNQNETQTRSNGNGEIDLSYFKTTVPPSVARAGSRKGSRASVKDDNVGRVAGGRANRKDKN